MRGYELAGVALAFVAVFTNAAGAAEHTSAREIARESARLKALVQHLEKRANPAALAREFRKLAQKGSTRDIRREASFHLAGLYRKHKSPDKALKTYDELSGSVDDKWGLSAAVVLGDMRRESGKLDAAVEAYERILHKNIIEPEAVRAALGVALVLEKRGNRGEARKSLDYARAVAKRLYEHDRKGIADALRAIDAAARRLRPPRKRRKPSPPEAAKLLAWGNGELARKRYGRALGHYNKLLERFPESKEAPQGTIGKALCFMWRWSLDEAEKVLDTFVESEPKGPYRAQGLILLGDIALMGRMNVQQALKHYGSAAAYEVGMHPSWREARWRAERGRGAAYFIIGDSDSALKHFRRASKLVGGGASNDTRDSFGMRILAGFCEDGRFPMPEFLRRQGSQQARVALVLADIRYESLDLDRAMRTYALVLDPGKLGKQASRDQLVYGRMMTAVIHDNRFEPDKAIGIYKSLIRDNPKSRLLDEVMFRLACVTFNQKRSQRREAAETMIGLSRRLPRSPRAPEALYNAAWMFGKEGHMKEARGVERELRARYPKSDWAEVAELDLDQIEAEARPAPGVGGGAEGGEL